MIYGGPRLARVTIAELPLLAHLGNPGSPFSDER
jgi:hypothetical protein